MAEDQVPVAELVCPDCGRTGFKALTGYLGHCRTHQPKAEKPPPDPAPPSEPEPAPEAPPLEPIPVAAEPEPAPVVARSGKPAVLDTWRQAARLRVGMRSVTMCDPRCHPCQTADNAPLNWYRTCPHDPYVTMTPIKEPPRYEDVLENGKPTGRKRQIANEVILSYIPTPNTREISLSMGANSGMGVEFARRKGYIMPSEVRSPHFPDGIADACQYRDCKRQTGLRAYETGTFCRIEEAQLVWFTETGQTLEVGEWSNDARQNRINMLGSAQVGAGVPA